jgi:signal transduction histidine kinase
LRFRVGLVVVAVAGIALGLAAAGTLLPRYSPTQVLLDLAVGWSMVGAGLLLWASRPTNRIGPLAVLTGLVWFLGDFTAATREVVAFPATLVHGWYDVLFATLVLAYPRGRPEGRAAWLLAAGFVAVQAGWTIAKVTLGRPLGWWTCPTCPDTIDAWISAQDTLAVLGRLETALLAVLSLGVLVLVVVRLARATGAGRWRVAPVAFAGLVLAIGMTGGFVLQTLAPSPLTSPQGELRFLVTSVLRVLVAVALVVGLLRLEAARGRIAGLVLEVASLPSTAELQARLRDALGDPTLALYRWDPSTAAFRDPDGAAADPPRDVPGRAVMVIEQDGRPVLAVAHDPALADDPGLVSAAVTAVRMAIENERLQAEVRTQLDSVRASRARIVEAETTERRRIERDLHDGAQQRLVSLQISLELLRRNLGAGIDPRARAELEAAAGEATAAIAEVRELARGLHPAILTEAGLGPALESLARRSVVPVTVDADLGERLPAPIEATAYFVVSEALANVAKHAGASRASVDARTNDGLLRLEIADNGRGGADPDAGSGLRGLEDRVLALGGTLELQSAGGAGTRLIVVLPCG